jgi:3-hydroxyacyl-[acyl-carrier-protein] dehydratase
MGSTTTLLIPPQHPAFEGHFPDAPLLPGVVLLDEMLRSIELAKSAPRARGWIISNAKFLHPVRPGETVTFEHEPPLANGAIRFAIRGAGDGHLIANGTLLPRLASDELSHGDEAR